MKDDGMRCEVCTAVIDDNVLAWIDATTRRIPFCSTACASEYTLAQGWWPTRMTLEEDVWTFTIRTRGGQVPS